MSPLHHDGEKITYQPAHPSWIDEVIAEARQRGEFDDLPGTGAPLQFKEHPLAGDWEMAFHVLENAGMAPPWMEMSREIREGMQELAELRENTAQRLRERLAVVPAADAGAPTISKPRRRFRWWPFCRQEPERRPELESHALDPASLEAERQQARRTYLEKAASVDELIAAYNAWLPENLRRLQKPRLSASRAAQAFDAACPSPITDYPTPDTPMRRHPPSYAITNPSSSTSSSATNAPLFDS
jgi:hypothetical protein